MDEGPFRASRPADRRTTRPEPVARPEAPQSVNEEPKATRQTAASSSTKKKSSKRPLLVVITIALVIIAAVISWAVVSNSKSGVTGIDKSKYQAVFFTNGQVYFGKLDTLNSDYLKMTDIYYLQQQESEGTSENPQETSADQKNVQLIKLGDEIHGPEDAMVISRDQVLFYENIKDDGKVAQSIASYKKSE